MILKAKELINEAIIVITFQHILLVGTTQIKSNQMAIMRSKRRRELIKFDTGSSVWRTETGARTARTETKTIVAATQETDR